ncbi:cysteine hydrolase family protein [Parasporobacterium paucivorans]|uniref:Nicotinamidase-related amidase n=1 Tax=Parasporobacterium paucivorans DSM 15970 TaxID=1122934 RepID=A0A1M6FK34_9FIRM|nr:isochorismatase family cysteine hydrolase [Parasporobacterium paucivorans]SHI98026.1 Nicotinamidase-related amidase [Parasporobacterium paucivorans DSM 15970]
MKRLLIVVDMQNDFIDGPLGTKQARAVVKNVVNKIREYEETGEEIVFTKDTHLDNFLVTKEGTYLPVKHAMKGSEGWEICPEIVDSFDMKKYKIYEKFSFGSSDFAQDLINGVYLRTTDFEFAGLTTNMSVISNALMVKTFLTEAEVWVDPSCCAGSTPTAHEHALEIMQSCQIHIK